MDIFRFINPTSPTKMEQGLIINGITSKMWIERYLTEGEFTLVAPVSSGLREKLPIGSLISHIHSTEIMIVENHEINEDENVEPVITVTGRGFETFFENRIVGSNKVFPRSEAKVDISVGTNYTWVQAVSLINDCINSDYLIDDDNALPYVTATSAVTPSTEVSTFRTVPYGTLYEAIQTLLKEDNLGIKVIRPNPLSPLGGDNPNVAVMIHKGVDRSASVIFSYDTGDVVTADYLWSNKKLKNAALVVSKWAQVVVLPLVTGYERRFMFVDASGLDQDLTEAPIDGDYDDLVSLLQWYGRGALASQNNVVLTKAEISHEATKAIYRRDFDVGDIITVNGNYNEVSKMRVSEFVEIEDENGHTGYPTLVLDEEL